MFSRDFYAQVYIMGLVGYWATKMKIIRSTLQGKHGNGPSVLVAYYFIDVEVQCIVKKNGETLRLQRYHS